MQLLCFYLLLYVIDQIFSMTLKNTSVRNWMAKHHPDLIFCRKQAGVAIGRLCDKCDGRCVICDSYVRPSTLVRICDECNYGSFQELFDKIWALIKIIDFFCKFNWFHEKFGETFFASLVSPKWKSVFFCLINSSKI